MTSKIKLCKKKITHLDYFKEEKKKDYRKDEVENEEDIFAGVATSVHCHDAQRFVKLCALAKSARCKHDITTSLH